MVNINSVNFNNKHSVITASLKPSSKHVRIIVPYDIDKDTEGNIMTLQIYKKLFSMATKEQLVATGYTDIQLKYMTKQQ